MKELEQTIVQINKKLATDASFEEIKSLLEKLISTNINICVINIELSNEEQLEIYRSERIQGVNYQNYEWASKYRDLEEKCKFDIDLISNLEIESPCFKEYNGKLYYFHCSDEELDNIKALIETI